MRTRWKLAALAATTPLLLTACGGDGGDGSGDGDELTEITVGVLPLADYAPVYWAEDHGQYEEQGLKVTFEPLQGGPVGIQQVVAGELDFAFSNAISSTVASAQGAPVLTVALVSGLGEDELGVFVTPDSPIEELGDLDGATVGINTTNNIGDVTFARHAQEEGVDAEPEWVEVPFPEMVAGVQNGSIEAGYLPEPYATAARQAGLRQVANLVQGETVGLPVSTFVTSTQFANSDADTVERFAKALNAARDDMEGKDDEFRSWWPEATDADPDATAEMHLPVLDVQFSVEGMQDIADFMAELGIIEEGYDASEFTIVNED